MELKLEDLMQQITLPKHYFSNTFSISEKFHEESEAFLSLLNEYNGYGFDDDKKSVISEKMLEVRKIATQVANFIEDIFCCYEKSDYKKSQELMDDLMKLLEEDLFYGSIDDCVNIKGGGRNGYTRFRLGSGYRFFRVRPVDYESLSIQQNADELFHIPMCKRAFSNNERFSLAGFPSLYLATMLPLAWQECGYPQKYYYSEYQYKYNIEQSTGKRLFEKEFKFLMLYSPDEIVAWGISIKHNDFELWLEVIGRYLKSYPLILACSFVNQSGKGPYKQEYIIPQMLMQWVQRNNSKVQGIEYFTCVDTSMWTSKWCAYNIVIPAVEPYDDKKYSLPLRENFCWSLPHFYSVPVVNQKYNEADREFVYNLLSEIRSATGRYRFPDKYRDILTRIINICGCLMILLENKNGVDMQLVLHVLNSLAENIGDIKRLQLKTNIEEEMMQQKDLFMVGDACLEDMCRTFKNILHALLCDGGKGQNIEQIIDKYQQMCWNYLHPHSEVLILYSDVSETVEPIKWFYENHILHNIQKIGSGDEAINYLKRVASEAKITMDELLGTKVESDDWLKENISSIRTPIFVKCNDVSIFSEPGTQIYEFVSDGFDKDILTDKLGIK